MSKEYPRILRGSLFADDVPKESMGKIMFNCLKQGGQEIAFIDAHTEDTITYDQILQSSIRMAYNFKKYGLCKNDVISIFSDNNIHYIIPVLAALYIGAIAHPVNAEMGLWELSEIYRISKPKWVFCSENTLHTAKMLKDQVLSIETIASFESKTEGVISFEELLEANETVLANFEPDVVNSNEDVAYIFNSSGTTGLPKCVMLTHYNAIAATKIHFESAECVGFQKGDVSVLPLPLSHIYGFTFIEGALISYMKCIIMRKFIPDLYLKSIELYRANRLTCPPSLLKFLSESPLVENYDLSSLKDITYGSAPLQEGIYSIIQKRLNVTFRQLYGLTELGGGCVFTPPDLIKPNSCGTTAPGVMIKIVDIKTRSLLACNKTGEICVKSSSLMKGYLNNLEETNNSIDDDGFYRTGDVGYYDEEGYIFIIDRLKDIIKYKGFQVSSTELENLILKHPAVADVGVIGIPNARTGEVPLAYVVVNEAYNKNISEMEIVEFVAEHISSKKRLHGGVRFIKEIPKNRTGKILKSALRKMYAEMLTHETKF